MYKEQIAKLFDRWDQILPYWNIYGAVLCAIIAGILFIKFGPKEKGPAEEAGAAAEKPEEQKPTTPG